MSTDRRTAPLVTSDNEQSFEATFKRYYPLVYQLAYRYVGERDEAEDIAQEVFLRFYRMPPHGVSEGEQRAWLCRGATNLSLNALRHAASSNSAAHLGSVLYSDTATHRRCALSTSRSLT